MKKLIFCVALLVSILIPCCNSNSTVNESYESDSIAIKVVIPTEQIDTVEVEDFSKILGTNIFEGVKGEVSNRIFRKLADCFSRIIRGDKKAVRELNEISDIKREKIASKDVEFEYHLYIDEDDNFSTIKEVQLLDKNSHLYKLNVEGSKYKHFNFSLPVDICDIKWINVDNNTAIALDSASVINYGTKVMIERVVNE